MQQAACPVARAVRDALDAEHVRLFSRQVRVEADITALPDFVAKDDVVYWCVYTIVRGLAARASPRSDLRVRSMPRAGGDVELVIEVSEARSASDVHRAPLPEEALRAGEHADLADVAWAALEAVCRVRGGVADVVPLEATRPGPPLARRYFFLIPAAARIDGAYERGLSATREAR